MKLTGMTILMIGIILFGISLGQKRYFNKSEFSNKYEMINPQQNHAEENYYTLREQYLTSKTDFENYGISLILLGLIIYGIVVFDYRKIKTPKTKQAVIGIGLVAVLLTTIAYVGDILLEMYRGHYPYWADSIAIPLMKVPFLILLMIVWVGLNSIGIINNFHPDVYLFPIKIYGLNYWYFFLSIVTVALLIYFVITGYFGS